MVLLTCLCRKSLHFAGNIQYLGIRRECIEKNDKKRLCSELPDFCLSKIAGCDDPDYNWLRSRIRGCLNSYYLCDKIK